MTFKIFKQLDLPENKTLNLLSNYDHLSPITEDGGGRSIPKLLGDVRRLNQVLVNLVKNALKFTPRGSIEIRACYLGEPDNLLIVHIKDTGKGILAEDIPKLFTRFGKL